MAVLDALLITWTFTLAWFAGLVPGVLIASVPSRSGFPHWSGWLLIGGALGLEVALSALLPGSSSAAAGAGLAVGTFWGWWHGRWAFRLPCTPPRTEIRTSAGMPRVPAR